MKKSSKAKKDEIIDIDEISTSRTGRNNEIMERVHAGVTYRVIAEEFGMTAAAISYIARQNGIARRPAAASQ